MVSTIFRGHGMLRAALGSEMLLVRCLRTTPSIHIVCVDKDIVAVDPPARSLLTNAILHMLSKTARDAGEVARTLVRSRA